MSKTITTEQLETLNVMADELKDNFDDSNKALEITSNMCKVLGIEPITFKSFEEMMNSDEPLIFK